MKTTIVRDFFNSDATAEFAVIEELLRIEESLKAQRENYTKQYIQHVVDFFHRNLGVREVAFLELCSPNTTTSLLSCLIDASMEISLSSEPDSELKEKHDVSNRHLVLRFTESEYIMPLSVLQESGFADNYWVFCSMINEKWGDNAHIIPNTIENGVRFTFKSKLFSN